MAEPSLVAFGIALGVAIVLAIVTFALRGKGVAYHGKKNK